VPLRRLPASLIRGSTDEKVLREFLV
jgi:hypothetical protein